MASQTPTCPALTLVLPLHSSAPQDYESQLHSLRQHNLMVEKTLQIRQTELSESQEALRALQQQTSVIRRQVSVERAKGLFDSS